MQCIVIPYRNWISYFGELEKLVRSGSFRGGQQLNEKQLAERFNVSRRPAREACRAGQDGLLQLVPNRGAVRQISRREAEAIAAKIP